MRSQSTAFLEVDGLERVWAACAHSWGQLTRQMCISRPPHGCFMGGGLLPCVKSYSGWNPHPEGPHKESRALPQTRAPLKEKL